MPGDAPSFDVARVRPPGQARLPLAAVAMMLTLGVAVALGVSERLRDTTAGAAESSASSTSRSPSVSPTLAAAASRPPRLLVPGDPVRIEPLLVHAGGPRMLDLEHGTIGPQLSAHPLDEWFQAPDGELLCLCRTVTRSGANDVVELWLVRGDADGRRRDSYPLTTTRSLAPRGRSDALRGGGTSAHAALAPDGRTLFVAIADRTTDGWRARVLVAEAAGDLAPLEVSLATALPVAPDVAAVDITWNGVARDGDAVRGVATTWVGAPDAQPHAFASVSVTGRAALIETWPAEASDSSRGCSSSYGPIPVAADVVQVCTGAVADALAVRRVIDGRLAPPSTVTHWQRGLARGEWHHVDSQRLVHWNPAVREIALIDLAAGALVATRDEAPLLGEASTQGLRGPTLAVDAASGTVTTLAAGDPSWVNSNPVRSPHIRGEPPRVVARYSLETIEPLTSWHAPSTATSLALSPDGRYVLVSVAPTDAEPYPNPFAGVIAYHAATGEVALVANRLGGAPIRFPGGSPAGVFGGG